MRFEASWGQLVLYLLLLGVLLLVVGIYRAAWRENERVAREAERAVLAEDERRHAVERSWVESGQWPLTHYDLYPTGFELTQDVARLKAMGYDIEWQKDTVDGVAVTYSLTSAYRPGGPADTHG
jgi:hypothetical protein